jgi:aryl-alcohol dehydrogenase-like predicted oxidoreductase
MEEMVNLGRTGLKVSRLCLGTATFGKQSEEAECLRMMDECYENGVRFIDTADGYPIGGEKLELVGLSETIIGKWIKAGHKDVVVTTKVNSPTGIGANDRGVNRKHIIEAAEQSLKRLGVDCIDLYQIHHYDPKVPVEETLEALDYLVRTGKVHYYGISNWTMWQLATGVKITELKNLARIASFQPRYNMLFRMIEEELVPLCQQEGIGVITFNPLAGGLLTGRYKRDEQPDENSRFGLKGLNSHGRSMGDLYRERYMQPAHFDAVEAFEVFCNERAYNMASAALAWVLHQPGITSCIFGASRPEQLQTTFKATEIKFTDEELNFLDTFWWTLPRRRETR